MSFKILCEFFQVLLAKPTWKSNKCNGEENLFCCHEANSQKYKDGWSPGEIIWEEIIRDLESYKFNGIK